jgi:hypothetical protein
MTRLNRTIVAGVVGTAVMSMWSAFVGMAGGPNLDAALLLSYVLAVPPVLGWTLHFLIGIALALIYTFLVMPRLTGFSRTLSKGVVFGLITFAIAMVGIPVMSAVFGRIMPPAAPLPVIAGASLVQHLVFGIVVVFVVDRAWQSSRGYGQSTARL